MFKEKFDEARVVADGLDELLVLGSCLTSVTLVGVIGQTVVLERSSYLFTEIQKLVKSEISSLEEILKGLGVFDPKTEWNWLVGVGLDILRPAAETDYICDLESPERPLVNKLMNAGFLEGSRMAHFRSSPLGARALRMLSGGSL